MQFQLEAEANYYILCSKEEFNYCSTLTGLERENFIEELSKGRPSYIADDYS
jgi:hypothetical protein